MESTSVKLSSIRSSPSVVLLHLSDAQNLMQTLHPGEGFQLFFLKLHHGAEQPCRDSCLAGTEATCPWTGQSHSRRAPEKCTQWHWTAPSTRQKPHQSAGTLKPCKNSSSSAWKVQTWQSSLGLKHHLQWMRHPCIRRWSSTKLLSNAGTQQFGKSKD